MQPMLCATETDPQENFMLGNSWPKFHGCHLFCKSFPQPADQKCTQKLSIL